MATRTTRKIVPEADTPKAPMLDAPAKDKAEDFKQHCIDLGIKICDDVMHGNAGDRYKAVDAVVALYSAVK